MLSLRKISLLLRSATGGRIQSMDAMISHRFKVLPGDLDENLHMNNARYLYYMELGRWDIMIRSGFLRYGIKNRIVAPVTNSSIVYRRSLKLFESFQVTTQIVQWSDQSVNFEHRILRGDQLCAVGLIQCRALKNGKAFPFSTLMSDLKLEFSNRFQSENLAVSQSSDLAKTLLKGE